MKRVEQAVILAAGRGTRLGEANSGSAKCLIRIDGATLIEHNIGALRSLGIRRITVVVGHDSARVRGVLGDSCDYVENPIYAQTNSVYSLWLAREAVIGSFILMNCDVLAHPEAFKRLLAARGSAVAYDSQSGHEAEHMKVEIANGRLRSIAKNLARFRIHGENLGILKFDAAGAQALFEEATDLVREGRTNVWAPAAVGRLANRHEILCIDMADLPWVEIDNPADLAVARNYIWPRVCGQFGGRRRIVKEVNGTVRPAWRARPA